MVELFLGKEHGLETRQAERYAIPIEHDTEIAECLCRSELYAQVGRAVLGTAPTLSRLRLSLSPVHFLWHSLMFLQGISP